jgi:hypothetical protein
MDRNDQKAIEALFDKLATVERNAPPRDAEAEAYIRDRITRLPAAPYYLAQTIVVQEEALAAAKKRIEELEARGASSDSRHSSRSAGSVPRVGRPETSGNQAAQGFLAGAAQTALGVTGGLLLGNVIAGMLGGRKDDSTQADEGKDEPAGNDEPQVDEAAFEDDGDFGDMDI